MAKNRPAGAKKAKNLTPREKRDRVRSTMVMRELNGVLNTHGITARIAELSFTTTRGASCTCPDGRPGVLRVIGGRLVCVCD
jgi:hypothetical protein